MLFFFLGIMKWIWKEEAGGYRYCEDRNNSWRYFDHRKYERQARSYTFSATSCARISISFSFNVSSSNLFFWLSISFSCLAIMKSFFSKCFFPVNGSFSIITPYFSAISIYRRLISSSKLTLQLLVLFFFLSGFDDDNSDYTLKKYVIQQNKVIQVNDAENKFVLFHEKDFGRIIQVRYKWKESWNESFS